MNGGGDGSASHVLAMKAWGSVLGPQHPHGKLVSAVILTLGGRDRKIPQPHWPATVAESVSSGFTEGFCVKKKDGK